MTTILTELDEFTADIPVPDGGDARTASSVRTAFQRLANRTKNLLVRLDGSGTDASMAGRKTTALASAHPGAPTNGWKLVSEDLNSSTGLKTRYYVGSSAAQLHLALTINAVWDPMTLTWSSDVHASRSQLIGCGILAKAFWHKEATASTWADSAWDKSPPTSDGANVGALLLSGDYNFAEGRSRRSRVDFTSGNVESIDGEGWQIYGLAWRCTTAGTGLLLPLKLRVGSTLIQVRAVVETPSAGVMTMRVVGAIGGSSSLATLSTPTETELGTASSTATTSLQRLEVTGLSQLAATENQSYYVYFLAQPGFLVHFVEWDAIEPGVRNG